MAMQVSESYLWEKIGRLEVQRGLLVQENQALKGEVEKLKRQIDTLTTKVIVGEDGKITTPAVPSNNGLEELGVQPAKEEGS